MLFALFFKRVCSYVCSKRAARYQLKVALGTALILLTSAGLAAPSWALDWQVQRLQVASDASNKTEVKIGLFAPDLAGDLGRQRALERQGVKAQYFVLPPDGQQPHRLVVDVPKAAWKVPKAALVTHGGVVDGLRFGQFSPSITRFVFELAQQSRVSDMKAVLWQGQVELHLSLMASDKRQTAKMHTLVARPPTPAGGEKPGLLSIESSPLAQLFVHASASVADTSVAGASGVGVPSAELRPRLGYRPPIAPKPKSKPKNIARRSLPIRGERKLSAPESQAVQFTALGILLPNGQRVPAVKPRLNTKGFIETARRSKPVIVIDPGHGGKDPGTRSRRGLLEKDVTLAFARALHRQLKASGRYQVFLSRSNDNSLALAERRRIGSDLAADLFVSIHADFIEDAAAVSGATIYTLSHEASDPEALASARRENESDNLQASLSHDPEVAQELLSMGYQSQKNQADFAAKLLVDHLRSQWPLHKKPHKSAGFKVLKSADVPSLLIEVGYMSNRNDLALMASPFEHRRFAALIEKGLNDYFAR